MDFSAKYGKGSKNNNFKMAQGELPSISQKTGFKTSYPRFSRMDEFSKLGVSAVGLALQDAGLNEWMSKREIGIVVATVLRVSSDGFGLF